MTRADSAVPERFPWEPHLPCHTISLEVGSVAYTEVGAGPPVILVHGYGDELFTWRHQLAALGDAMHLYALDLIGYGFSAQPAIPYTADTFISCVTQFMQARGIVRATVVGSSMGAATALGIAKSAPERVDRLVLLGPTLPGVQPSGRAVHLVFWLAHHGRLGEFLLQPGLTAGVRLTLREAVADAAAITSEIVAYYARLARRPGFKHVYLSTARHWDTWAAHRPRLGELKMPVLAIWGHDDRVHPFRQAGLLRTLIPQAEVVGIPRCGHLPQSEHPEAVNRLLRAFVSANAPARAARA